MLKYELFFISSTTSVFIQMTGKEMMAATVRDHHPSHVLLHLSWGQGKSLLEVFSTFHHKHTNYSAHWSGGRGSRFNRQTYHPCPHTHSLFSFSWLNPSLEDCAHHKHRSTQIQAKYFKAMLDSLSTELSMNPRSLKQWQKPWGCLLSAHHAGPRYTIARVPLSTLPTLLCIFPCRNHTML